MARSAEQASLRRAALRLVNNRGPVSPLNRLRHRFRLPAWTALWAVWAMALMPAVSQMLVHAGGGGTAWAEVCTPQGTRWVALPEAVADGAGGDVTHPASHLEHCPLCRLAHDAPPLPARSTEAPALLHLSQAVPALFLHAPQRLHAWRSAQPRGPPLLS